MLAEENLWNLIESLRGHCLRQETEIRKRLGLSRAEYLGLRSLEAHERITCRELARRMELSLSRSSRVIERLVRGGLLERTDCTADRRCRSLSLTEKGSRFQAEIQARLRECESRLLLGWPASRISDLHGELNLLVQRLSRS
jgi:DNA-binding MarR family transcriptional regulator